MRKRRKKYRSEFQFSLMLLFAPVTAACLILGADSHNLLSPETHMHSGPGVYFAPASSGPRPSVTDILPHEMSLWPVAIMGFIVTLLLFPLVVRGVRYLGNVGGMFAVFATILVGVLYLHYTHEWHLDPLSETKLMDLEKGQVIVAYKPLVAIVLPLAVLIGWASKAIELKLR